jgi:hypothetical protein
MHSCQVDGLINGLASTKVVEDVKTTVDDAAGWGEKKAEDLSKEDERGVGPYANPATCVPSDLDPLAIGIMLALEAEAAKSEAAQEGHDVEVKKEQGNHGGGNEEKKGSGEGR